MTLSNKVHAAGCKNWHGIFAHTKATTIFATADV